MLTEAGGRKNILFEKKLSNYLVPKFTVSFIIVKNKEKIGRKTGLQTLIRGRNIS